MGVLRKNEVGFDEKAYIKSLEEMSIEYLKDEIDKNEVYADDLKAMATTNKNMIDKFYDNPAFEHLFDMNIADAPKAGEVALVEYKIKLGKEVLERRLSDSKSEEE